MSQKGFVLIEGLEAPGLTFIVELANCVPSNSKACHFRNVPHKKMETFWANVGIANSTNAAP